jgi:antitoxin (DNA-binding transcriptional repressor) of toxin-antitoxin stability system
VETLSIRDLNANLSKALARVEAGETLALTKNGRVFAEVRPRKPSKLDDPEFAAALERLMTTLEEGLPGLNGPASYEERTE